MPTPSGGHATPEPRMLAPFPLPSATPHPLPQQRSGGAPPARAGTAGRAGEEPAKLHQAVDVQDVGPCKKHIKVTVERGDINARFGEKFTELVHESNVNGFRPGKAPRRIIERRFKREV